MSIRKRLTAFFMTALLLVSVTVSVSAIEIFYDDSYHEYKGNIFKLKVDGQLLEPEMPPIVFDDYSVVPARAVFQDGLGATVSWDGENRQVIVKMGTKRISMTIDKTLVNVTGQWHTMPIAPKLINGHTMIPVRFVAEKLGMLVDFDSATDTIIIESVKPTPSPTPTPTARPSASPGIGNTSRETVSVSRVTYQQKSETEGLLSITTNTRSPGYSAFILENPTRLVVDVEDGVFSNKPSPITMETGNVTQIRFGQQETAARTVIDLTENLGYEVKVQGKNILVSIVVDPEAVPRITDIFKEVTYGYEGGRDYIKFDVEMGTPKLVGSKITVPIKGMLPEEAAETNVVGFFGKKMKYTPGVDEETGTITIELKSTEAEMYVQGKEIRLKSIHKALPRSVMLDAGHGGQDAGAVAYNEDGTIKAMEKDFNLDVALRAKELLEAEGVEVHMIRTEDVYVDFLRVGGIANDAGTSLFVSIHTNSATMETPNGIETFGYLEAGSVSNGMTGERLSQILLDNLIEQTGAYNRGVKEGKSLAVINSTKMPATLIEIGFISNTEECEKMMTEEYRQKLAQAVCDGVLQAFEEMEI
ncbi:MAG: AMIN domain-containing protein [Ruminococcaceae bacterium]|nr:AMIN domain-containing protein [Oscillospiraceae bacterium]